MEPAEQEKQLGQVRALIADLDAANQIFTNEQLTTYLDLNDWDTGYKPGVYRAAADALDAIAVSEVLTSKVIRTQDLSTDGAKVAETLRRQAEQLRGKADELDPELGGTFEIIDTGYGKHEAEEWRVF